jgi:hypothetical protein
VGELAVMPPYLINKALDGPSSSDVRCQAHQLVRLTVNHYAFRAFWSGDHELQYRRRKGEYASQVRLSMEGKGVL